MNMLDRLRVYDIPKRTLHGTNREINRQNLSGTEIDGFCLIHCSAEEISGGK
jgi:hypothetical protein